MPKSTESVSETDQDIVSDKHLMTDNICTHKGQDILLKSRSCYVLTSSSIFFVYTSKHLQIQLLHYNTVQASLNATV